MIFNITKSMNRRKHLRREAGVVPKSDEAANLARHGIIVDILYFNKVKGRSRFRKGKVSRKFKV